MKRNLLPAVALLLALPLAAETLDDGHRVVVSTTGAFADVRQYVADAIVEQGLVESSSAHVAEMLERTGKDLGAGPPTYLQAEVVEFCSAQLTRAMVAADPHDLVSCPYRVAVYVLASQPDTVYLAYPKPTAAGATPEREAIEALLRQVVESAL